MLLWGGSLGLAARLRGDAGPSNADISTPSAKNPGADYKLEWKGGGCEQWDSFGGQFVGIGHTVHSCFEGCAARQIWKVTKSLLSELSTATADCCDAYAASELRRSGHSVADARAWRAFV